MVQTQRYRLKAPTLAVDFEHDRATVRLPAGAVVQLIGLRYEGASMVQVEWRHRILKMFLVDLYDRGEQLEQQAAQNVCLTN